MKGAPIKPGSLCIVVAKQGDAGNGRIVEAVEYLGDFYDDDALAVVYDAWDCTADWLGSEYSIVIQARYLRPITDHDADITEREDALMDNLLDALATRYAPTEAV